MADASAMNMDAMKAHATTHGPKYAAATAVLLVLLLIMVVYIAMNMGGKDTFDNNLMTGGNNPMWWHGMGDAGWGGSMHSTYHDGDSRVYGASAPFAAHDIRLKADLRQGCGAATPMALAEASALTAAGVIGGSAKNMDDNQLMRVMNGGGA